jgi:hypothetical protein
VAACGHRFAAKRSVSVIELADEPFVHYDQAKLTVELDGRVRGATSADLPVWTRER